MNNLTPRQQNQVALAAPAQRRIMIAQYNRQNSYTNVSPFIRTTNLLRNNATLNRSRIQNISRNLAIPPRYRTPYIPPPSILSNSFMTGRRLQLLGNANIRTRQSIEQPYDNGGNIFPNQTTVLNSFAPTANGFSLVNSGERNVTFAKEYVAKFLTTSQDSGNIFRVDQVSTHPATNSTTGAVCRLYQRYKVLSFAFKYKASCPTTATGMHFTGVDYGNQVKIPVDFREAESLEHFSVGPIWQDSQNWHLLKMANMKERWFSTNMNSEDPESRPARIIFGSLGVNAPQTPTVIGAIEVRVTYLFNGLGQNFTGEPPPAVEIMNNNSDVTEYNDNNEFEEI